MAEDTTLALCRRVAQITGGNVLGLKDILNVLGHPDVIGYTKTWIESVDESVKHRDLLIKYISHVGDCEGVDFLGGDENRYDIGCDPDRFTDEEWDELLTLRQEAD